jgi:hypothetical protein
MSKLNVNRMRRYSARTTPDEIRTMFDPLSDDYIDKSHRWLDKFRRNMMIKHGEGTRIDIYVDDGIRISHEIMVIARVRIQSKTKIYSRQKLDLSNLPSSAISLIPQETGLSGVIGNFLKSNSSRKKDLPLATIGMPIHKSSENIHQGPIKALCVEHGYDGPGYNLALDWNIVDCPKCLSFK